MINAISVMTVNQSKHSSVIMQGFGFINDYRPEELGNEEGRNVVSCKVY